VSVLSAGRIARPSLAGRLRDGLESGSVLLVAGAGYGKTMALEEAIELAGRRAIWVSCGDAGGEAGRLFTSVVQGLRTAVPGLADVMGDALVTGPGAVDVRSAASALLADLEHLLVEPLVIVFDDAEELRDDEAGLALPEKLLGVRGAPLSVAIATRRELPLRVAKLRASGRLTELGPAELGFTAAEIEELLHARRDGEVGADEVEAVLAASEGWPMLAALSVSAPGEARRADVSSDELFDYLAEEVLDRLEHELREAVIDSSVADSLDPNSIEALGLRADLLDEVERFGVPLRRRRDGASYHPLFRDFLRGRLRETRSEEARAELHARLAESLSARGAPAEAIDHWLAASRFDEALASIGLNGAGLIRTSPETVSRWLDAMPPELRRAPDYLLTRARLMWAAGEHQQALEPLRAAAATYREAGNVDGEWLARIYLADTLVYLGEFEEVLPLAEGWEKASGPFADAASASVAWYEVIALSSLGRFEEAEELSERLRADTHHASLFGFLDAMAAGGRRLASGDPAEALELFRAEISQLEVHDPLGAIPYLHGMVLVTLRTLAERGEALAWLDHSIHEAERVTLGFAIRDFRLQRASLLAQTGELAAAEAELAAASRQRGSGWRAVFDAEAEAHVAALRGDDDATIEAAKRALEAAALAPVPWRPLVTSEMAILLAGVGEADAARKAIRSTLAYLDESFPGDRGRLPRAWLLASLACIERRCGDTTAAAARLAEAWEAAGDQAPRLVRAHWPALSPVMREALAGNALSADAVLPAMRDALPGGEALISLIDHPHADVRRDALLSALAADHPAVLDRLAALAKDSDASVASAAVATRERMRADPPPLRFELLGGFKVLRAGWELDEESWKRPIAARVVRFLLVQDSAAVPEDALFEAFWADKPAETARQNLAAAISRARKVLDLPGAERSVIDLSERTYRINLRERDSVDAAQFEAASEAALAQRGDDRRAALERAAELWTGEPLPADRYAEWSFAWRERLVETHSQVLAALIDIYVEAGETHRAIRAARALLEIDPLNEETHRQLMLTYARSGRTSHALRQFLECRRALVVELGVEPSEETARLQARLLAGESV
jgi:ATP/maltotriose-dependent transcriptional regulator MalT/DNA-binding SARP family transcriptional activator